MGGGGTSHHNPAEEKQNSGSSEASKHRIPYPPDADGVGVFFTCMLCCLAPNNVIPQTTANGGHEATS